MSDQQINAVLRAGATLLGRDADDEERGDFVRFQAPFTFVPLEPVCASPWGIGVPNHSRPHKDGISGELTVTWRFDQSVLIGGAENNGQFATIDGKKILPGATTRGLIRNVLEIATGARMRLVDRKAHHGVRDMHDESGHWKNHNPVSAEDNPNGGANDAERLGYWLSHDKAAGNDNLDRTFKGWQLTPCREAKVEADKLFTHWRMSRSEIEAFKAATVQEKYRLLAARNNGGAALRFDIDAAGKAIPSANGKFGGWLFFTGADPKRFTDPRRSKKHETVFFDDAPRSTTIAAPEGLIRRFFQIYGSGYRNEAGSTGALGVWLQALADRRMAALPGVEIARMPVFMIRRRVNMPGNVTADALAKAAPHHAFLAMSRMVKVPYKYSIGDILDANGHKPDGTFLDFTEALFGFVPDEIGEGQEELPTASARKGRVAFGIGAAIADAGEELREETGATMAPRTSFWPFYAAPKPGAAVTVRHCKPADWSSDAATVAGWKRYPVRPKTVKFPEAEGNTASTMRFTKAGTAFQQRIKLHNLLPEELGGLLWALTLGAPDGLNGGAHRLRHAIGRGKAQGYGKAWCQVRDLDSLERNDGAKMPDAKQLIDRFKAYVLAPAKRKPPPGQSAPASFEAIRRIAILLGAADPAIGEKVLERLAYPHETPRAPRQANGEGETESLAGYRKIRKAAREKGRQGQMLAPILPRYPDRDPEA